MQRINMDLHRQQIEAQMKSQREEDQRKREEDERKKEQHRKEMEILEIKKEIAKKQLENISTSNNVNMSL